MKIFRNVSSQKNTALSQKRGLFVYSKKEECK